MRALFVLALCALGCEGTRVGFVSTVSGRWILGRRAEWLTSAPTRPYREIGVVEGVATSSDRSREKVIGDVLRRAGREGCDAVVEIPLLPANQSCAAPVHVRGVCIQLTD